MTPLRQRMLEDMQIRNLSRNTQLSYLQQVSSFAKYCQRSPEALGPEEVRAYQVLPDHRAQARPGKPVASSPRRCASCTRSRSSATGSMRRSRCPRSRSSCR